ncbi:bifunctional DNA primase/polymerase [Sinorhizobium meliloti]|uniref:bifunctional DNA primase/polymerase n=1 Tax=Rhizobium meliloti TaxID=382 RepID=UPI000FD85CF2|nr:bifunctional DNA primase/polymerase [Sinorhizobium meliloti]RVN04096.1 DUF3987 domain-containing protein [Sinorhizobium meliloti]
MTTSPYASVGQRLVDMGYSAVPVLPGSKRPGQYVNKTWYGENDWQRFGDRLPTKYEVPIWSKWPEAGVCVVLDDVVKVVDIDSDDAALIDAVMAVLPPCTVRKRGAKGFSLFYRGSADIVSRPFNIKPPGASKPIRAVDLLAKGRQTVLPPTMHPETEQPYVWIDDDSLADMEPHDLAELPVDVADRIAAALEPFGFTEEEVKRDFIGVEAGDSVWREIKDLALANLDMWVPDLGIPLAKRSPGGTYRGAAVWRGGDGFNVSFHGNGIRDMAQDMGLTPIDVVMKARSMTDMEALAWLKNKLDYVDPWLPTIDFARVIRNGYAKHGTLVVEEADIAEAPAQVAPQAPDDQDGQDTNDEQPVVVQHDGLPPYLCEVPGLVGDIVSWLNRTARNPSPTLNLGAALSYVGALAGRRYEGPTKLRSNVYVVGLAASGFGKEHPRAGIKALASASGTLGKFFGGNKISSSSALRNRVKQNPSLVYMIDEFGGFMRKVTSAKSGNHEKEIAEDLLEMTGTAGSIFMGADYAQNLAEPIHNPNVCIYGTSTPEAFWKALASGSVADGFLPRFIMLDAGTKRPPPRDPLASVDAPPSSLVDAIQAFVVHKFGGKLNGITADGSTSCKPVRAVWGEGAKRVFDRLVDQMFRTMDTSSKDLEPIYARVAENSMRLALIVAAGTNYEEPVISEGIMQWAAEVAIRSAAMLIDQAEERMADNDRQAEYKRVRSIIDRAGGKGTTPSDVARALNGIMDRRRMHDIIEQLTEAGQVVDGVVKTSNGRQVKRLWSDRNAPVALEAA